jgi:anthranilate synthase component 2
MTRVEHRENASMLLMIDNYDSFTYNLVQYLGELGEDVRVYRNDQITVKEIGSLGPERIVISPGPCTPNEAGVTVDTVKAYGGKIPMLGVCLGHQGIGQAYGGKIVQAKQLMHGKTSMIHHDGEGVFVDLPTAWTDDDEIMAIRHKDLPVEGVQFHPESILTEHGHALLKNFLSATRK